MRSQRTWQMQFIVLVVTMSVSMFILPAVTSAVSDKQCKEKDAKGKYKNDGKECTMEGGGTGKCKQGKCELTGDGKMPMLPMLPMLPMPMPMPPPPPSDSNCNNGVGGIARSEAATTSTTTKDQSCPGNSNPYWDASGSSIQPNISQNINDNTSKTEKTATQNVSDLFHDLFGDSGTDFTSTDSGSTTVVKPTPAPTSTPRATPYVGNPGLIEINPGVSGNIEFHDKGATIHITRESGGTTVAGFYGSDSPAAPTGLVQGWCASRPWTTNFLAKIIPSGFFDGLCTLRGYAVGIVPRAPNANRAPSVEVPRQQQQTVTSFTSNPIQPVAKPKVTPPAGKADIWAVPSSVRLGSRATVFWNAVGVTSCEETSPEGGFTHNTISGGAETVAISGPTTFVITCTTLAGTHISNYTTVNLAN